MTSILRWVVVGLGFMGSVGSALWAAPAPVKAKPGQIVGRVTFPDGRALTGDVRDVFISIYGVSEVGEKVQYSPAVSDEGVYRQKAVAGSYAFNPGQVKIGFGGQEIRLTLEPVGRLWNRNREVEDGIVQDFVLKLTGPTPYGQSSGLDPNNHTHWYGMSVGLSWQTWRADKNRPTSPPPEGTRFRFSCRAVTPGIDGQTVAPFTLERDWAPSRITPIDGLNDLPPASYEITGEAVLPNGRTVPVLFQGRGDYPNFVRVLKAPLESGGLGSTYFKLNAGFIVE